MASNTPDNYPNWWLPASMTYIFMMTSSNRNIFCVTGPLCGKFTGDRWIPSQRPVTRSFDVFFYLRLNKRLSKQSRGWWFKTSSRSLWRHCNVSPSLSELIGDTETTRNYLRHYRCFHYCDVTMSVLTPQITSNSIVCLTVCSGVRTSNKTSKLRITGPLVRGNHRWPIGIPLTLDQKRGKSLRWGHNDHDGVSNHQPNGCLLNRLFRRRSKKTSKLRVTGFCVGNSPGTGEFPAQRASYAENVSIWWRHHVFSCHDVTIYTWRIWLLIQW